MARKPGTTTSNITLEPKKKPGFIRFLWRMTKGIFIIVCVGGVVFLLLPRLITEVIALPHIAKNAEDVPATPVAIVFGAGLRSDGTVTRILRDRVEAAVELYNAGKVEKLLMSGDNRYIDYNEPGAMYRHAVSLGVPSDDIVMDFAGRRTYDTCYRAKEIFGVSEAVVVTQRFHLPRAIFLCNHFGIETSGYSSNMSYYRKISRLIWNIRELPATLVALSDAWITQPVPVLGDPEPIFPE
jgi:SanA protein